MWNDFEAFIARGNVLDLAIALIVGFVMFLIAKMAMAYFAKLAAKTLPPPQEALLMEIRDILRAK